MSYGLTWVCKHCGRKNHKNIKGKIPLELVCAHCHAVNEM